MKLQTSFIMREYLRPEMLPTTWCGGCGLGIIMSAIVQAIHFRGLDKNQVAMVSGIGCTGRMSGYVDFYTLHTTHGRAPAFATGLKLARPDLTVVTVMGDGDAMSIGGNHLIHAMRRNIGMVAIVVNNNVYGLTGGQSSPTTPIGGHTTTTRVGSFERPMNLEALARAAGAPFYARATVNHTAALTKLVELALGVSGFALIEVISNCHVLYGKMNEMAEASRMIAAMDADTQRTNPTLQRRGQWPLRLTSPEAPSWQAQTQPLEGVSGEPRIPRGLIFQRTGSVDFSRRYYAKLDEIRAKREKGEGVSKV
ncbi:MAG TPA: thiamine pyrophosphate-dependent enzyme [Anaerolineales bacterium]|nr:thiamine pyrophosphate-dependent enzyme [Anaerolineales bacterium]